ncbi:MAG TPA: hypothetical protein PK295_00115 [Candidatus Magasanikbacteria bacterium]|nr:hypothetical protein [Candidatus Magasanikbacteria bacterium]
MVTSPAVAFGRWRDEKGYYEAQNSREEDVVSIGLRPLIARVVEVEHRCDDRDASYEEYRGQYAGESGEF